LVRSGDTLTPAFFFAAERSRDALIDVFLKKILLKRALDDTAFKGEREAFLFRLPDLVCDLGVIFPRRPCSCRVFTDYTNKVAAGKTNC
jgi:hypothetical protein